MINVRYVAIFVLSLALVGCGSDEGDTNAKVDLSSTQLRYVPDDSPYVFAMLEPLPSPILERFSGMFDEVFVAYKDVLLTAVEEGRRERQGQDVENDPEYEKQQELLNYFAQKMFSEEGLKSIGFGTDSTFVLFGHGLLPVLRIQLTDGELMRNFIAEAQEEAEKEMPTAVIDGQAYWHTPDTEKAQGFMAVIGDELVLTFAPSEASDDTLKALLGLSAPERNASDNNEFAKMLSDYGYVAHGVSGVIDFTKIADVFLGEPTGINAELVQLMDFDNSNISDICKAEIREMIDVMPRMVTGYTKFTPDEMVSDFVIEIREDLATSLTELAAPVPGVGTSKTGMFSFGMGFDIPKSIEFAKAQIAAVEADPYECEYFADMQSGLDQMKAALAQPIPPFVSGVKGFNFIVDEIEMDDQMQPDPNSIKMRGLIAVDNAPAMWGMATMFSPELAQLGVEPNQKAVEVDTATIPGFDGSAFVGMGENSIALSVGLDDANLDDIFNANVKSEPPVISMAYDLDAYLDFVMHFSRLDALKNKDLDPEEAAAEEAALELVDKVMSALDGVFGWTSVDMVFTEKGFKLEQLVQMK
ncbi:MAG: hypothetical protein AAF438_11935 [Pseudomonadota bacterium]